MALYKKKTAADVTEFFEFIVQSIHKNLKLKQLASSKNHDGLFFGYNISRKLPITARII